MSTNTVKASDIPVVPFFARFLVEETPPQQPDNTPPPPPPIYTLKFPSDLEDF
ncbi:microviridin/marinostatin family tricyclic proteinase inhibitor [Nodularia sphaerocarpa]|uniref:microviridin/marinostatin family tricyclic proteinase inhibitor n=1 Tax=Nodularia sphaerocarpa TaxID=137816 RepID=UPI00232ACAD2|nr:microviridin/marinostatin family tricyclic proteinase inhibitor [Nodularia sphaerocarpa]MDB9374083.1 microviridin/marinostatin family tricyclic proteinase inhibitor [Nodularia sphaerocarpa CS-585]